MPTNRRYRRQARRQAYPPWVSKALETGRPSAPMRSVYPSAAAWHEAGHGVAAWQVGCRQITLSIDGGGGQCVLDPLPRQPRDMAFVLAAGHEATERHTPRDSRRSDLDDLRFREAIDRFPKFLRRQTEEAVRADARRLVRQRSATIYALALRLETRRRLEPAAVSEILRRV